MPKSPDGEGAVRLALVGSGHLARAVAPALLLHSSFHLKAVWSRSKDRAEAFNNEVAGRSLTVHSSEGGFDQLCARRDIDACVVTVPAEVLLRVISKLHKRGKGILLVPPSAMPLDKARQILPALEKLGQVGSTPIYVLIPAAVAPELRFGEHSRRLRMWIDGVGSVLTVSLVVLRSGSPTAGQLLLNSAGMFRDFFGSWAQLTSVQSEGDGAVAFCGHGQFNSGAACSFSVAASADRDVLSMTVVGEAGRVHVCLDTSSPFKKRYRAAIDGGESQLIEVIPVAEAEDPQLGLFAGAIKAWKSGKQASEFGLTAPIQLLSDLTIAEHVANTDNSTLKVVSKVLPT
mmetsp:Transcript_13539/g.30706  ORF Transcript_13539/g.30706 Transcript_13539/m.30706 type:complete len:345 (+) Transcript_13539:46-1080(+)